MKNFICKNLILTIMLLFSHKSFSQLDVSTNPVMFLVGDKVINAEFIVKKNLGISSSYKSAVSGILLGDSKLFTIDVMGKYYFRASDYRGSSNWNEGGDKWYFGAYLEYEDLEGWKKKESIATKKTTFILGLAFGYKVVSKGGVIFEIALGGGKRFTNSLNVEEIDFDELSRLYWDDKFISLNGKFALGYRIK